VLFSPRLFFCFVGAPFLLASVVAWLQGGRHAQTAASEPGPLGKLLRHPNGKVRAVSLD
jgi:hypothetical protein